MHEHPGQRGERAGRCPHRAGLQWLGWAPDWRRLAALRRDWLAEAQRPAAVLACSAGGAAPEVISVDDQLADRGTNAAIVRAHEAGR